MGREEASNAVWVLLVATLEIIAAAALRTLAAPRTSAVTEEAARQEKGKKASLLSNLLFNYCFLAATQDTIRRHEINSRLSFEVWSLTLSCRGSEEVRVRVFEAPCPKWKVSSYLLLGNKLMVE